MRQKLEKNIRKFTKGNSTLDYIKDILNIAKEFKSNKTTNSSALILFDFTKVYDFIHGDKLINKLKIFSRP